ncbi:hypothetical protein K0M31_013067, partial [Melipona bicolor]
MEKHVSAYQMLDSRPPVTFEQKITVKYASKSQRPWFKAPLTQHSRQETEKKRHRDQPGVRDVRT